MPLDVPGPHSADARTPQPEPGHSAPNPADGDLRCSARGCHNAATWALAWNNPRLHTPDRRKTWLACDEHRESLSDFLSRRGFLRETTAL